MRLTTFLTLILSLIVVLPASASATDNNETTAITSSASQFDAPLTTGAALDSNPPPVRAQRHYDQYSAYTNSDYWIYDSWVSLQRDRDADGYYSSLSITFDADTIYNAASVYAVVFIGRNDAYSSIYTTSIFTLYGNDSEDALTIDSELVSGFPPREYNILLELYDADTHELLAYSDDYDDADLAYLSMESKNHDQPYQDSVVIVEKHGGSMSLSALAGLLALALPLLWWRIKHKR